MRIANKIASGYLVLVVALTGVLAYEFTVILELQRTTRDLYDTYYRAGLRTTQLLNELHEIESLIRGYFVTGGDRDYKDFLDEKTAIVSGHLAEILAIELPPDEERSFQALEQSWVEFKKTLEVSITSAKQEPGPPVQSQNILRTVDQLVTRARELGLLTSRELRARIESSRDSIERVGNLLWMGGALALAAGLIVGLPIVRSITRPLHRLTRATRAISGGDLRFQVEEHGNDEVAELAKHFNLMVRRLGESDELKSGSISRVSHELKAPMASIQETISLLLEQIPGPLNSSQERLLQLNRVSGERLSRMIDELLQMSRLESGIERYSYGRIDVGTLVRSAVKELEPVAAGKGIRIELLTAEEPMMIECDSDKMIQVVRNLVDNAIKFSPPSSAVRINLGWKSEIPGTHSSAQGAPVVCPAGRFLMVSVADQGPGVRSEEKERIFEKFHQSKQPQNRSREGTGLGLAIASHIVRAHAGAIWVEDHPGGGSEFKVLICCTRARGFTPPFAAALSAG